MAATALLLTLLLVFFACAADAFVGTSKAAATTTSNCRRSSTSLFYFQGEGEDEDSEYEEDRFSPEERLESLKSLAAGAVSGGIFGFPMIWVNDILFGVDLQPYALAQAEYDADMAALQAGLFAITYRYAVRYDANPQLNQGVVLAFAAARTLSQVEVSPTCKAMPLRCGKPLIYLDWDMLTQIGFIGFESLVLFSAAGIAMNVAMNNDWIRRFRG